MEILLSSKLSGRLSYRKPAEICGEGGTFSQGSGGSPAVAIARRVGSHVAYRYGELGGIGEA